MEESKSGSGQHEGPFALHEITFSVDIACRMVHVVWSKISNALKRLGFRSRNFLAQLLSETSRAGTIRVRQSSLGRLWNDLGSHACLHHRNRRPGTFTEERISGGREPDLESPNHCCPVNSWFQDGN